MMQTCFREWHTTTAHGSDFGEYHQQRSQYTAAESCGRKEKWGGRERWDEGWRTSEEEKRKRREREREEEKR